MIEKILKYVLLAALALPGPSWGELAFASAGAEAPAATSVPGLFAPATGGGIPALPQPGTAAAAALPTASAEGDSRGIESGTDGQPSPAELFFNADPGTADAAELSRKKIGGVDTRLKPFGFDFFRRGAGFDPDQLSLVGPDYVIGPGDTLRIDIWGNVEGSYPVTVDRNGEILLPRVGVVSIWGQTFAEAKETIRRQVGKYFTNFELNVTMGAIRSIQVYLVGEVHAPGTYRVSSLSTVLTALSAAGGPAPTGSLRQVRLVRPGEAETVIDFYDFFLRGDRSRDLRLQSGDTLFVPVSGPQVGVAGNVRRPGIYEIKGGETLAEVLELAGGTVPTAYLQKVQVERIEAHQKKLVLDLDLQAQAAASGLDLPMRDRDLVKVAPIAFSGGYVLLEGYVVRPGSYQLTKGMRLSDLILPYDNLLPEFYPGAAQVIRLTPPEYRPALLTVDLEKALAGDPGHDLLLQEYDTVKLFSRREMEELPQVVVSGAVLRPGEFRLFDNMTVRDLVAAAGNLKRSAFVEEAEITRFIPFGRETKTERVLIDLEKALAGDPAHNLALRLDDHLFVRSIPDYAEKHTVQIRGEVLFPGTYAIGKGEKLASVIRRAGGYTGRAYLRGAVFTRESLKEVQRQSLQRLIAEQEQEMLHLSAEMAGGALDEEALAAAREALESRQKLLARLKQVPVSGRMVVRIQSLEELVVSSDNIELMAGDSLVIPENPQTVSVLGEVYNPTSLSCRPGRTVAYYLDQVGGATEEANEDEMFIVRADGTVVSRQQSGFGIRWDRDNFRWITGGFHTTELHPGDTLLVPQQLAKRNYMRDIKDITQILYQMGLGAAAISVL